MTPEIERLFVKLDDLAIEMDAKQHSLDFPLLCMQQRTLRAELSALLVAEITAERDRWKAHYERASAQVSPALLVSVATQEHKEKALGGVSPTAVDAVPCSAPTDAASHDGNSEKTGRNT